MAVDFLVKNDVTIKECNYRNRFGEIDIIGYDGIYLVFFEVKYRTTALLGMPEQAVTRAKQKAISKVSDYYRMKHHIGDFTPMRYDVISICGDDLKWYKNAFDYCR